MSTPTSKARQFCEDHLRGEIKSNNAAGIAFSESRVATHLLGRGGEMEAVYEEIYPQLCRDGVAYKIFLNCLLWSGAYMHPDNIAKERSDRAVLQEVNLKIQKHAEALAVLLDQRSGLHNRSGFSSETLYDICEIIEQASECNGRFQSFLKGPLAALRMQFDLKYWPSPADCIRVLSKDAADARIAPSDPVTEAATRSKRASKADFIRGMLEHIEENRGDYYGRLPRKFTLSCEAIATIANVLLSLHGDELVDAVYVKNLRHRDREKSLSD
ncbi:hypothetical protein J5226_02130 [Lysobacter sp. K5869]|uniref:hypothetical protein n=1 Tax=Lysobacter sp. K5869 TaxID=2820808 RepID=UPI001C060DBB|nr:hypothetical protein [Lysobacter sp. K5869]QWP77225.1 hypothetical protein J5226_02130 [Lysobacter sp. K5869]